MKKLWTAVATTFLAATLASPGLAQNLGAGVKAGISLADLGGDFEDIIETSTDLRTGFSVGAFLGADLHRLFRLQGELQYVQKGAEAEVDGVSGKFELAYIELLVPATLLIPVEGASVVPRVYAGPAIAFELDCKVTAEEGGISLDVDCEDADAPTKSVDFGIFAGAGLDIMVGPGMITLDVLYNLGITDINDFPDDPLSVKNRTIQILAGYGFRFGT